MLFCYNYLMEWLKTIDSNQLAVLERPVSSAEAASYRRHTGISRWSFGFYLSTNDAAVLSFFPLGIAMLCMGGMAIAPHPVVSALVSIVGIGSGLATVFAVLYHASQRTIRRHVRMHDFAARCGLAYDPIGLYGAIGSGVIFHIGHSRRHRGILSHGKDGQRLFEAGLYQYTIGSGKYRRTRIWQYAAMRLPRRLPHILLDSADYERKVLGKRAANDLPGVLSLYGRRMSLEGDFDKYFTLYGPQGYDIDVRYILTPDVMAALIGAASQFDVEIVDDMLFFYIRHGEIVADETRLLGELLHAVAVAGREIYDQVDRYTDDQVPNAWTANAVAEQGRRLWR